MVLQFDCKTEAFMRSFACVLVRGWVVTKIKNVIEIEMHVRI